MWFAKQQRLSDGAKALWLVLDQPAWTHRRVESLEFAPNGESRRTVSWDFTVPENLAIRTGSGRVAVPLATLSKRNLKRLDVRDRASASLPVWGRDENGRLAARVLAAGMGATMGEPLSKGQREAIDAVVFASNREAAATHVQRLFPAEALTPQNPLADTVAAVQALAETLAGSFLLVVEIPEEDVGRRTLVKIGYDDDRLGRTRSFGRALGGRLELPLEVRGWSGAQSWHPEVRAPGSLAIDELDYRVEEAGTLLSEGQERGQASTAHVAGAAVPLGADTSAHVTLVPRRAGLVNQVVIGAALSLVLLGVVVFAADAFGARLGGAARPASLAPVALSLPAILLAALARAQEHQLVSHVLLVPRLVSFLSAVNLWLAAIVLIWTTAPEIILLCFAVLAVLQAGLLAWIASIWSVSGRG